MFRAFVDESGPRRPAASAPSGSRGNGMLIGVVVLLVVAVAAVAWLTLK